MPRVADGRRMALAPHRVVGAGAQILRVAHDRRMAFAGARGVAAGPLMAEAADVADAAIMADAAIVTLAPIVTDAPIVADATMVADLPLVADTAAMVREARAAPVPLAQAAVVAVRAGALMAVRPAPVVARPAAVRMPAPVAEEPRVRVGPVVAGPSAVDDADRHRHQRIGRSVGSAGQRADLVDADVADHGRVVLRVLSRDRVAFTVDVDVEVDHVGLAGADRIDLLRLLGGCRRRNERVVHVLRLALCAVHLGVVGLVLALSTASHRHLLRLHLLLAGRRVARAFRRAQFVAGDPHEPVGRAGRAAVGASSRDRTWRRRRSSR